MLDLGLSGWGNLVRQRGGRKEQQERRCGGGPGRGGVERIGADRPPQPQLSPGSSQIIFSYSWSFVWSTLGVTAMAFVTGALGFWAPKFLFEARVVHGLQLPCFREPCNSQDR